MGVENELSYLAGTVAAIQKQVGILWKLGLVGLPVYLNNAAAIAGGLTAGMFYRTGGDPDPVCVVH